MPPELVKVHPFVHVLGTAVAAATALFATQGLITNSTEKLVTGLAAIFLPVAYLLLVGLLHLAHARVTASRIAVGLPTVPQATP